MYHFRYYYHWNKEWAVKYFFTSDGKRPFADWFNGLDRTVQVKLDAYIGRLRAGNFGNCKPLKGAPDIYELVMDFGPGYRAYYIRFGKVLLLVFCGGMKKDQKADIKRAIRYLEDFNRRWKAGTYQEPELEETT